LLSIGTGQFSSVIDQEVDMKRSTALALLSVVVSSIGVLCATAEGRQWLLAVAGDQVDSVLDTIAVTPEQRQALEQVQSAVQSHVAARVELLRSMLRCAAARHNQRHQVLLTVPPLGPLSDWNARPQRVWGWSGSHRPGDGYLPPRPGSFATEWRSCRPFGPR